MPDNPPTTGDDTHIDLLLAVLDILELAASPSPRD